MIACFTGHRPDKLGSYNENNDIARYVKSQLEKTIEKLIGDGYLGFISGGALGVDTWAAEIVLKLKDKYPNIHLVVAKPFSTQDKIWPKESQERYKKIIDTADEVLEVNTGGYAPWKMQKRNEYMVQNSDLVIAVWDGSEGGTGNCVAYARRKSKNMIIINPKGEING